MRSIGVVFIAAMAVGCGPKAQTSPPPATASNPPPAAEQTPPPAAQTPPPPQQPVAPDRRPEVIGHLDAIDHELHEATEHKMVNVTKQAQAIHEHVTALADPIAAFPQAADTYAELKKQSHKFLEAARSGDHHDLHEHHGHLVEIVKQLRTTVGGTAAQ